MPMNAAKLLEDWIFGEAIAIALFTGWAYLISFIYESGYLSFFELSPKLIIVEISSVLFALTVLGTFILSIAYSGFHFFKSDINASYKQKEIQLIVGLGFFMFLMPFLIFGFNLKLLPLPIGFISFVLFRVLKIYVSKGSNIDEKLKHFYEIPPNPDGMLHWASERIGKSSVSKIMFFFFTLYLAYFLGQGVAVSQKTYYLIEGDPELAIITMYGDRILAMPVNRELKRLEHKLYILNTSDLASLNKGIKIEKIGKLSLVNNQ